MLSEVFSYLITMMSKTVSWLFTLVINENPRFTFGEFILACAFIGIVIYFIFGTDFFPGHINMRSFGKNSGSSDNYQPRHAPGTAGRDYSTRESRHKY